MKFKEPLLMLTSGRKTVVLDDAGYYAVKDSEEEYLLQLSE